MKNRDVFLVGYCLELVKNLCFRYGDNIIAINKSANVSPRYSTGAESPLSPFNKKRAGYFFLVAFQSLNL
jgi:hypothetical protein